MSAKDKEKERHARIYRRISSDHDYRALNRHQQHLYLTLVTRPDVNLCGVLDWRPNRIAVTANGWTVDEIEEDIAVLIDRRYVVVDVDTEELLIRSAIRNDGIMSQPNMVKSMVKQAMKTHSLLLLGVLVHEIKRYLNDFPDTNPRSVEAVSELIEKPSIDPFKNPIPNPYGKGSAKGSGMGNPNPSASPFSFLLSPFSAHSPHDDHQQDPLVASEPEKKDLEPASEYDFPGFNNFWKAYPRKDDKKPALKAFKAAVKRASTDVILDGAKAYAKSVAFSEKRFIKLGATWLNGDCWTNNHEVTEADEKTRDPIAWAHRNRIPEAWA